MASRTLTSVLVIAALLALPPRAALAQPVMTERLLEVQASAARERVLALTERADVARELQRYGIAAEEAAARLAALSDAELEQIARQLDTLPAASGFGEVIVAALVVFLILAFLDVIGVTDVFPWIKSQN
jgi:hypothetical protein